MLFLSLLLLLAILQQWRFLPSAPARSLPCCIHPIALVGSVVFATHFEASRRISGTTTMTVLVWIPPTWNSTRENDSCVGRDPRWLKTKDKFEAVWSYKCPGSPAFWNQFPSLRCWISYMLLVTLVDPSPYRDTTAKIKYKFGSVCAPCSFRPLGITEIACIGGVGNGDVSEFNYLTFHFDWKA